MDETTFGTACAVAPHPAAASAAREILIEGGTALEAAVAAAAVCAVVLPERAGVGGDGLWVVREPGARGRTRVIDARGTAAGAAALHGAGVDDREPEMGARYGPEAVLTIPGAVSGWAAALDLANSLGARMPVARLLEPAVRTARDGFRAPEARHSTEALSDLVPQPGFGAAFLVEGRLRVAGTLRTAVPLAETLSYLVHAGLRDFYVGDVGREIAVELDRLGSPLTRTDLGRFEARWRQPRAYDVRTRRLEVPPTGRAMVLALALGLGDRCEAAKSGSVGELHAFLEAFGRARALVADTAQAGHDLDRLLSERVLAEGAASIDGRRAHAAVPVAWPAEDGGFIGVIDAGGLAVSLVHSIGTTFGTGVVLRQTGVLMGNRGASAPSSYDGFGRGFGWRAPMSTVPVLTSDGDGRVAVMGATGAGGVAVAALVAMRLQSGASPGDAIDAPRLAPGPDGTAWLAEDGFDTALVDGLRRLGHPLNAAAPACFGEAGALVRRASGRIDAGADARLTSAADGF